MQSKWEGGKVFFFSVKIHYYNSFLPLSSACFVLFTAIRTSIFFEGCITTFGYSNGKVIDVKRLRWKEN